MIKLLLAGILGSVIGIGLYEKVVLGLDRENRNAEAASLLDGIADIVFENKDAIPFVNNKDELKAYIDSAGSKSKQFFSELQIKHQSKDPSPYR